MKIETCVRYCFTLCGVLSLVNESFAIQQRRENKANLVRKYLKKLKKEDGAIKLVGGSNDHEGNVEILHEGKWGAVCDDEWDIYEAEIVCKQLGFTDGAKPTHNSIFGVARRKFWMDNIYCDGTESELSQCRFEGWGNSDCEPEEAAGVICKQETKEDNEVEERKPNITNVPIPKIKLPIKNATQEEIQIRLMGGRVYDEGRVEIKVGSGPWGTLCGDGWTLLEGAVICRQLGFGYANDALQTDFFGRGNGSMILSGTKCHGNEPNLSHCLHDAIGNVTCPGIKGYVAAVTCTDQLPDLVIDHIELERTAHLEDKPLFYLQCAMEENCLGSQAYVIQRQNEAWHLETRRLLRFTARVLNAGNADFRPSIPKHLWEWHMCHRHYHSMEVFATFDIINSQGIRVAEGHKASFCLEDNLCIPGVKPKYACANYGEQGISVNCSDIYRYNIDCQWVDISELIPGIYRIKVSVNPEFKVAEITFDNNAAVCELIYTVTYARLFNCRVERP